MFLTCWGLGYNTVTSCDLTEHPRAILLLISAPLQMAWESPPASTGSNVTSRAENYLAPDNQLGGQALTSRWGSSHTSQGYAEIKSGTPSCQLTEPHNGNVKYL
jgi:hypothetical protein